MSARNDELLDLLAARALGDLSPEDEARLDRLLEETGHDDTDDMALAAAAAMNAFGREESPSGEEALPEGLRRKLEADANAFFRRGDFANPVTRLEEAARRRPATPGPYAPSWLSRSGWAVAAVLALVVLVALGPESEPQPLDPAAARESLLARAETSVVEWGESDIPAYGHVRGDVVWNDAQQKGYLRLTGMPANDPAISQYQLWIVDPDRDTNPVDGGVFNVPKGAREVIIPITAKLDVSDPQAFAITREKPGGVVVSDGPMLLVAAS